MKRKPISKSKRDLIYKIFNGRCGYCGSPITKEEMEIDHSGPIARSNSELVDGYVKSIYNMVASCADCNRVKSTMSSGEFALYLDTKIKKDLQKDPKYRVALKFGIVSEPTRTHDVEFYRNKIEFPEDLI